MILPQISLTFHYLRSFPSLPQLLPLELFINLGAQNPNITPSSKPHKHILMIITIITAITIHLCCARHIVVIFQYHHVALHSASAFTQHFYTHKHIRTQTHTPTKEYCALLDTFCLCTAGFSFFVLSSDKRNNRHRTEAKCTT